MVLSSPLVDSCQTPRCGFQKPVVSLARIASSSMLLTHRSNVGGIGLVEDNLRVRNLSKRVKKIAAHTIAFEKNSVSFDDNVEVFWFEGCRSPLIHQRWNRENRSADIADHKSNTDIDVGRNLEPDVSKPIDLDGCSIGMSKL